MKRSVAKSLGVFGLLAFLGAAPAQAERLRLPQIEDLATAKECGACHMVYAPQMLPRRSWAAVMSGLDKHFGENAQLDEAARTDVETYLLANAADSPEHKNFDWLMRGVKPEATPARITEMPWWLGAHREANVSNLRATKIKFAGNCIGCHVGSDKTMVFNEPGD